MDVINTLKFTVTALVLSLLAGCSSDEPWMNASGSPASVPKDQSLAFESYVSESLENIEQVLTNIRMTTNESPYVGGYSVSDVAKMRGPFQIPENISSLCNDKSHGAGKGFLLIHGLTDSPYLLRNMADSLASAYPCSLIRAVLLPGHGTVVGDTLDMKYQDWMRITEYGVQSFQSMQRIDQLYLVGFSTGTALAIKHLKEGQATDKIKGLVLLSTAVQANSDFAWLTSYLKVFKSWLSENKERDAARYSSFSTNAGSQFYQLTKGMLAKEYQVDVPVFMAVSADDATINAGAARDFYCNYVTSGRRQMFWYRGFSEQPLSQCSGIVEIERTPMGQNYNGQQYKFANHAHTGIAGDPSDNHYGVTGVYRDCKAYESAESDKLWRECMKDSGDRVFSEKNVANMSDILAGGMWRRATFNKDYQQLSQAVVCFVNQSCVLESGVTTGSRSALLNN